MKTVFRDAIRYTGPDYLSNKDGAQKLADIINRYWKKRGIDAGAHIVKEKFGRPRGQDNVWGVRSHLTGSEA